MRSLALFAFMTACSTPPPPTCTGDVIVLAEAPDFSASELGTLSLTTGVAAMQAGSLLQDPVLATSQLRHFVISRKTNVIYELDGCASPSNQYSALTADEVAAQADADPQDVAVDSSGALWIARFDLPSILITSPLQTIDLSAFDADGRPDMSSVKIIGHHAFVALERLTVVGQNFVSQQASQVVVLDTDTKALVKTITLVGRNPFGQMVVSAGKIWLAEPGNFSDAGETAAGIETIDPLTFESTLVVPETALGASAVEVAANASCAAAIVADATTENATSLVSFSLDGTNLSKPVLSTPNFWLSGLLWTNEAPPRLLVGDATNSGGNFFVHVFSADPQTCALTKVADWVQPNMPALAFAD
jgi:DNA-binding beta-propeller fold protein YncE